MRAAGEVVVPRSRRRVIGERAGVRSPALPVKMPNARMLMRWIAETRGRGRGGRLVVVRRLFRSNFR